jgi:hypothetical protein
MVGIRGVTNCWPRCGRIAGAQRFACNWGLARVKANLAQREAERSYGIPDEELTPPANWSAWELRKEFNQVKDSVEPRPPPGCSRCPRRSRRWDVEGVHGEAPDRNGVLRHHGSSVPAGELLDRF